MPCTKCKDGKYKWGKSGECKYESKEACESANKQNHKEMKYVSPLGKTTHSEYVEECKSLKLATEKIELNIQDEVTDALDLVLEQQATLNDAVKEMNRAMQGISGSFFEEMEAILGNEDIEQDVSKLTNAMNNMDTTAGELGLDPSDFSPDYKKAINVIDQIERDSLEWYGMYEQARVLAKALR